MPSWPDVNEYHSPIKRDDCSQMSSAGGESFLSPRSRWDPQYGKNYGEVGAESQKGSAKQHHCSNSENKPFNMVGLSARQLQQWPSVTVEVVDDMGTQNGSLNTRTVCTKTVRKPVIQEPNESLAHSFPLLMMM